MSLIISIFTIASAQAQSPEPSLTPGCYQGLIRFEKQNQKRTVCIRKVDGGYLARNKGGFTYLLRYVPHVAGKGGGYFGGPRIGDGIDEYKNAKPFICNDKFRLNISSKKGGISYQQTITGDYCDADPGSFVEVWSGYLRGLSSR